MIGRRAGALPTVPLGAAPDGGLRRFVALAPGEAAPLLPFDLPAGVTGPARMRIARRQLVDRLGQVGARLELHPLGTGAWTRAVVVSPEIAAAWRADPLVRDRRCAGLAPDYLALPTADGLVALDADKGRWRVRLGLGDGFSAPAAVAAPMLRGALGGVALRAAMRAALVLPGDGTGPARAIVEELGLPVASSPDALPALGVDFAGPPRRCRTCGSIRGDRPTNLPGNWRSGRCRSRSAFAPRASGRWRRCPRPGRRGAETEAVQAATHRPDAAGTGPERTDPRHPGASRPGACGRGRPGSRARPDRAAAPGPRAAALAGRSAEIAASRWSVGRLRSRCAPSDFEAVEALGQALRDAGLAAETLTARAADTGVEARIALSEGGQAMSRARPVPWQPQRPRACPVGASDADRAAAGIDSCGPPLHQARIAAKATWPRRARSPAGWRRRPSQPSRRPAAPRPAPDWAAVGIAGIERSLGEAGLRDRVGRLEDGQAGGIALSLTPFRSPSSPPLPRRCSWASATGSRGFGSTAYSASPASWPPSSSSRAAGPDQPP